jgi:hypothetical protein
VHGIPANVTNLVASATFGRNHLILTKKGRWKQTLWRGDVAKIAEALQTGEPFTDKEKPNLGTDRNGNSVDMRHHNTLASVAAKLHVDPAALDHLANSLEITTGEAVNDFNDLAGLRDDNGDNDL